MQHLIELSLASTSWSQATAKRFSPSWSRFGCFKSWNIFFYLDLVLWSLVFKWGAWNDLPDVIIVRRKHESFQHCLFLFLGDCSSSLLYVVKLVLGRFCWWRAIFLLLSWSLSSLDDCWSLEVQMALSSSSSDEDKINFVFKLLLNLSKDFGFESGFWKAEHESLTKKRKKNNLHLHLTYVCTSKSGLVPPACKSFCFWIGPEVLGRFGGCAQTCQSAQILWCKIGHLQL